MRINSCTSLLIIMASLSFQYNTNSASRIMEAPPPVYDGFQNEADSKLVVYFQNMQESPSNTIRIGASTNIECKYPAPGFTDKPGLNDAGCITGRWRMGIYNTLGDDTAKFTVKSKSPDCHFEVQVTDTNPEVVVNTCTKKLFLCADTSTLSTPIIYNYSYEDQSSCSGPKHKI